MLNKMISEYTLFINNGRALNALQQKVQVPVGAELLSIQVKGIRVCLWVEHKQGFPPKETEELVFRAKPSGMVHINDDDEKTEYLETVQFDEGEIVRHIYLVTKKEGASPS